MGRTLRLYVEGLARDHRGPRAAADVDLELGALGRLVGGHVGHADAHAEARRHGPRGHLAAADDRIALAGDARLHRERDELLGRAGLARGAYGVGADEAGVLLARPAQAGLDRAARRHQVVAVEVVVDLQAQRVAGGQAGGHGAAAQQLVPQLAGVGRLAEQLDAVLARIAGAADQ